MIVNIAIDDDESKSYDIAPHKSITKAIIQVLQENRMESKFNHRTCGIWRRYLKKWEFSEYADYKNGNFRSVAGPDLVP